MILRGRVCGLEQSVHEGIHKNPWNKADCKKQAISSHLSLSMSTAFGKIEELNFLQCAKKKTPNEKQLACEIASANKSPCSLHFTQ